MAAVCSAQPASTSAAGEAPENSSLNRKIEVMIRSELNVPPDYQIVVGPRQKSDFKGYDTIPVTFSLPNHPDGGQTVDFLLSKDGNTLARLSRWNIGNDPMATLAIAGRPVRGNPQAKVTIVNFDDLECPYCARLHNLFFPATLNHYKGLVRFIYIDFPLVEIHPWAMHAAVDANCLAAQSSPAYWNYVDYLHEHNQEIGGHDVSRAATQLDKLAFDEGKRQNVDTAKLDACMLKQDTTQIQAEMKAGDKLGVNATPTFFVNGERWAGDLEQQQLWMMINRALKAEGITPPPEPTEAAQSPAGNAATSR